MPSQSRITPPGTASAVVTRKKRKPARERRVGIDADGAEEADEEGLAHGEPVERERHEQDEEEERAHHVVDARREVDARRPARSPRSRGCGSPGARASARTPRRAARPCAAEGVHALVERPQRPLEPEPAQQRPRARRAAAAPSGRRRRTRARSSRARTAARARGRRRRRSGRSRARSRPRRAGRVAAPPSPRSSRTIAGHVARAPGWRREVSTTRTASPPIAVGRICPAAYETK